MSRTRAIGPAAMGGVAAHRGLSSILKRPVMRGVIDLSIATSATATLTPAVVPENCRLRFLGVDNNWTSVELQYEQVRLALTNSTTITATRFAVGGLVARVSWELTEYMPGILKSVTRDTITITGATSGTRTIPEVDPDKAELDWLGQSTDATTDENGYAKVVLTNKTTVTASRRGSGAPTTIVAFQVVEFF